MIEFGLQGQTSMRRSLLSDAGQGHSSTSNERDRVQRQKRRRSQRFSLEPLETRCLLSNITAYPLPTDSGGVEPNPVDITSAGGKLWFAEQTTNAIGMLNPTSPNAPQAFPLTSSAGAPGGITTGPDGNVWFTLPSVDKIGTINTTGTPQLSTPITLPSGQTPQSLAAGKTLIWYIDSSNNALGSFNPSTDAVSPEILLGPARDQNGNALVGLVSYSEIVVGTDADHIIWFTEYNNSTFQGAIGSYDPVAKTWAQYPLGSGQKPYAITTGPGGSIWFSEAVPTNTNQTGFASSALGVINPGSTTPTEYALATTANGAVLPYRIVEGPDLNIWYSGNTASSVGVFNVATKNFASENLPQATAYTAIPDGITVGPDGNLWIVDDTGAIDVKLLATKLVVTTPPSSTITAGTPILVTITAEDASNNVDPTYIGYVTLAAANGTDVTVAAVNGVATFSGSNALTLDTAGSYTLTATASGLGSVTTGSFNVTSTAPNNAAKLYVWSQPTTPVAVGSPFNLVIIALTSGNGLAASYSGSVTVNLVGGPAGGSLGGLTTVVASRGDIVFSGLTLNLPGTYYIEAKASGLTSATTTAITVSAPPPQIQSATVLSTQKTNPKNHRPVGKPVLNGYKFTFNMAMNQATTGSSTSYQVDTYVQVKVKVGRKTEKKLELQPIGFTVNYLPSSNAVQLILTGKQAFKYGGQITLIGTGISSARLAPCWAATPSMTSPPGDLASALPERAGIIPPGGPVSLRLLGF